MNPLHAGNKTHKQRIQPGPETQGTFYQKSDIGGIRGFRKITDYFQKNLFHMEKFDQKLTLNQLYQLLAKLAK